MSNQEITEAELAERSQKLSEIEDMYEEAAFTGTPKIPCNECGGVGTESLGVFGTMPCHKCGGKCFLNSPFCEQPKQPDFKALRAGIREYSEAKRLGAPLPPESGVFSLDNYKELFDAGKDHARQLQAAMQTTRQLGEGE